MKYSFYSNFLLTLTIIGSIQYSNLRSQPVNITYQSAASFGVNAQEQPQLSIPPDLPRAKNVILFIGDGMGAEHRKAAQWSQVGLSGILEMDNLSASGWLETHSADNPVTDSAAAATAMATGEKTDNGIIGMDPSLDPLTTILELARDHGKSVGLVTTTQISHATPAGFAAHVQSRSQMTEIAEQMLNAGVHVLLGGGEDQFLPSTETGCYPGFGERVDGKNLINQAVGAGYTYVCDSSALAAVNPSATTHLLGLFADEGLTRPFSPTLAEMTQKAIDVLSQNPNGFFLMVESGQIDWASHANNAQDAIADTVALNDAVKVALDSTSEKTDTLVIITADHETGGFSASTISSGLPEEDGPFLMPDTRPFYINWTTGGHTSTDVPVTAIGPLAEELVGTHDNTFIYDLMLSAVCESGFFCTFRDVLPIHWAYAYIESITEDGIARGYPDSTYHPEDPVTRAETAVFLLKGLDITPPPVDNSHSFPDISGHWAEAYIEELNDQNLSNGYLDNTFRPENPVTRAEIAVLLLNSLGIIPPAIDTSHPFIDIAGHWAEAYIEELYDQGMIGGYDDNTYRPESQVTRGEMAVFLVNAFGITLP